MLILSSTNDRLQIITGQAGTIDCHASWMDNASGTVTPGRTNTAITTATTTNVVGGPGASTQRNVKTLHVANRGAAGVDITVQHTDGTTVVQIHKVTLQPGTTLEYIDEVGFIGASATTLNIAQAFSPEMNLVINSGLEVGQEFGTASQAGLTAVNRYVADMFGVSLAGAVVVTTQLVADAPPGYYQSLKVSVTTADTSIAATDKALVYTVIEGYRCAKLQFGTANALPVSVGFWVKAHRTGSYSVSLENFSVNRAYPVSFTVNAADTWEYKTVTFPGDTTGTWQTSNSAGIYINWVMMAGTNFTGTANTWNAARAEGVNGTINGVAAVTDVFQVTGVSLIAGIVPLAATVTTMQSFDQELLLSQRYYEKSFAYATAPVQNQGGGVGEWRWPAVTAAATTQRSPQCRFRTLKRTSTSAFTFYNPAAVNAQVRDESAAADCSATALSYNDDVGFAVNATGNASTAVGNNLGVHWVADARL